MIDLHYWTTPNGHKITIFLEEARLPYRIVPVNISKGDQFKSEFLAVSPNNRIPAIVDHDPMGGGTPVSVFESGAILLYLAEKTGQFLPHDLRGRYDAIQWLFWQMGGLGPMAGQNHHFSQICVRKAPLRHRSLCEGDQPSLWGAQQSARRSRLHRRRLLDCRHGILVRGDCRKASDQTRLRIGEDDQHAADRQR
jgi:glutathione S-transferase